MNLIKIGNLIYNAALMIEAEFTPAATGVDEESGQPFSRSAKLEMRFAAPMSEARTDYNGDYIGEETMPYCRILRGEEAEEAFSALDNLRPGRNQ